jgi:hypothetical protein
MQKLLRFAHKVYEFRLIPGINIDYSVSVIIRSVLIMKNPNVVYQITKLCYVLWMNCGLKRIGIYVRCCLHGIRGPPAT